MYTNGFIQRDRDTIKTFAIAILLFGIFFLVMWRGSQIEILDAKQIMQVKPIVNTSNSTVKPLQDSTFLSSCQCTTDAGQVMTGAIDKTPLMGQVRHEGNSPYRFIDCQSDAQEMVNLLQDEYFFRFGQSLTRSDIGTYPPQSLHYTWDQEQQQCRFYLGCNGMKQCDKRSVASGMVLPKKQV
jgi:hypothetical protein